MRQGLPVRRAQEIRAKCYIPDQERSAAEGLVVISLSLPLSLYVSLSLYTYIYIYIYMTRACTCIGGGEPGTWMGRDEHATLVASLVLKFKRQAPCQLLPWGMGGGSFPWGPLVALTAVMAPNLRPIRYDVIVPESQCNCTCPTSSASNPEAPVGLLVWWSLTLGVLGLLAGICIGCGTRSVCRTRSSASSGKGKGRLGQPSVLKSD